MDALEALYNIPSLHDILRISSLTHELRSHASWRQAAHCLDDYDLITSIESHIVLWDKSQDSCKNLLDRSINWTANDHSLKVKDIN